MHGCQAPNMTSCRPLNPKQTAHLLEDAEQHVCVQGALVGLVHDDCRIVVQIPLPQGLPQQHPVRHVLDHRLLTGAVLKADRIAHLQQRPVGRALVICLA